MGSISLGTVLFWRGGTLANWLQTLGHLIFIVLKVTDCSWQSPPVRGNWSVLPFPSCAWFKVRFPSPLCVLAVRLFQWCALSFRNISLKDYLLYLPTSSRILNHLRPRPCELAKFCLRKDVRCLVGGLEAEPSPSQWSRTKERSYSSRNVRGSMESQPLLTFIFSIIDFKCKIERYRKLFKIMSVVYN